MSYFVLHILLCYLFKYKLDFFAIDCSLFCGFCSEGFPLPIDAWDRMRFFIVILPGPSLKQLYMSCPYAVIVMMLFTKHKCQSYIRSSIQMQLQSCSLFTSIILTTYKSSRHSDLTWLIKTEKTIDYDGLPQIMIS